MMVFRKDEAVRILVVAAMMATLASAAGELARRLAPGFDPTLLVMLAFLVCLEGVATDRLGRQLPEAGLRLRLRIVEWVVILFLLRLALSLSQGFGALGLAISSWLARPQSLFDTGLLAGALLLFATWGLGLRMSQALESLGPEADAPPPKDSAAYYAWLTRPRVDQRGEGWQNLVRLFLGGGVLLLMCSGLARLDVASALSLRNPSIAGIVGNAFLYFLLGFALLAHGHFAVLRAGWERNAITVAESLTRRWVVLGGAFAAGVALLVLLLPTRPSLALFGAVFDVLWLAFYYVAGALLTVLAALGYLLALLGSLLGLQAGGGEAEARLSMPLLEPPPPAQRVAWWEAIQGLVLWAVILAVLLYAAIRFVRERRGLWQDLAAGHGPLGWMARLLLALWRWLARTGGEVAARWRALVAPAPRAASSATGRRRLAWLRPQTLRERVRLLYLIALEQTARQGLARKPQDTPYEFLGRVTPQLPDGQADMDALTQAFVAARYSRKEFAPGEVGPLQVALRRLRSACRRLAGRRDGAA